MNILSRVKKHKRKDIQTGFKKSESQIMKSQPFNTIFVFSLLLSACSAEQENSIIENKANEQIVI